MSIRAIVLGLALGLFVASVTYFNDQVIRQTYLVGQHLPPVIFGGVALLLFAVHPLLRLGGRGGFRAGEVAVITAIALAACGWPGNSFYRAFAATVAMPSHWGKTQSHWIAGDVFSFVPGGSGALAPEFLPDAPALAGQLRDSADAPDTPAGRVWRLIDGFDRQRVQQLAASSSPEFQDRRAFAGVLNRVLAESRLYNEETFAGVEISASLRDRLETGRTGGLAPYDQVRANRALLAATWPELVLPAPRGEGLLLLDGRADSPTHDLLMSGAPPGESLGLTDLPWGDWWPTLRLWGSVTALLGLASLCLALLVHPQWSQRELLPYPIARFVQEIARTSPGQMLPEIVKRRGFWIALGAVTAVHLTNGLHAYFEHVPAIPLSFDFNAMRDLFPNASRIFGSHAYFQPNIYLAVIAFTIFLSRSVSFSLGIAHLLLMMLGASMVAQGIPFDRDYLGGSKVNMLAFGSYLAMAAIIVYTGRRYYANVAASMLGLPRSTSTPGYAPLAGWVMLLCLVGAVVMLNTAGVPVAAASAFVLLIMLLWLVMSRISAETGVFLIKPAWLPVGILTALFGFEAIGPMTYIALAVATIVIVGEAREAVMPYLTNGLRLADQAGERGPRRAVPWMAIMVVSSLIVAGGVSLLIQHNVGLSHSDTFATRDQPSRPFNELANYISGARAHYTMDEAVTASGWERWSLVQPEPGAIGWAGLGFALVLVTAAARLRLPWWPVHPVIFLVWGTFPMFMFSFSILLGWAIKSAIVGVGGARAYHTAMPIAAGVILADIASALGWSVVGAAYYFSTDTAPPLYRIFPG